jgi:hypothetical protein
MRGTLTKPAEQPAAREGQLRHRLIAALGDGPGAIGDALAAFQVRLDGRMVLEALELVERRQPGVLVIQVHHVADGHVIVPEVVHEAAAAGLVVQRPAGGVLGQARLVLFRRHLPQFLDADAELLRRLAGGKVEPGDQLLGQRTAHALGDEHVLAVQLHAGIVVALVVTVLGHADDADHDALDRAVLVPDQVRGREAGIDLDAQFLGLGRQPAAHIAQRGDVAAVVVHERRHGEHRQAEVALRAQQPEDVLGDRRLQRRAAFLPVREQLGQALGIDHRPRQDVGADLRTLFQHRHRNLGPGLGRQLLEPDGGRQARRSAADDDDVVFHRLAFERFAHAISRPGRTRPAFLLFESKLIVS